MNVWLGLTIVCWLLVCAVLARILNRSALRRQATDRLRTDAPAAETTEQPDALARWLYLAGYRTAEAKRNFLLATVVLCLVGFSLAWLIWSRGLVASAVAALEHLPGTIGDLCLPVIYAGPWVAAILMTSLPWAAVRSRRRKRVEKIEQDLPVTLELLATLSEAGLGFDSALARVLDSQPAGGPLADELRGLQADIIASRPRVECFRRLARRIELTTFNIFISAVVQAEQVGAGIASVLRRQADDLRARRREDAMAMAMALPVKRLFPMVICFMPGVFVVTLGPAMFEFLKFAETFIRNR
ncbi:MAG TPA: type II secretion system F family protein [Pirellulales bacterium]|jgi:tight adherence protein C|nr:type II secretion system F family protein [Pirellulales bacterium]